MVSKMYKEMYSRWLAANLDDPDLKPELESIQNDDAAIQDRFAVALKFGTAGLRGVIRLPRALPTGSRPRAAPRPLRSAMTAASRAMCLPRLLPKFWPPTA